MRRPRAQIDQESADRAIATVDVTAAEKEAEKAARAAINDDDHQAQPDPEVTEEVAEERPVAEEHPAAEAEAEVEGEDASV